MPASRVPELSLKSFTDGDASTRAEFTDALMAGLRHYGFIILKDHGIHPTVLHDAYAVSKAFFDLSVEEKRRYIRGVDGQRGYTPLGREHAKDASVADLKEFWHIGREVDQSSPLARTMPSNVWPDDPARFRQTFLTLFAALEDAGFTMLQALAPALGVSDSYFRDMATNGNSILRLLHYPPIPDHADPRAMRAAPHEDINLITILVAANGAGLELLDRDGNWLPIETDPENLIVDAGDMLARITNNVIPATTHRVVNPQGPNVSRYSMPFFLHPHPEAILDCIPSCRGTKTPAPPITAIDFLKQRLKEIGLA
ncbi:MAG: isopenicillin N synthase family dioxygenase [Alphaproteobacteria bacterium]